jgi:hypothetical protein
LILLFSSLAFCLSTEPRIPTFRSPWFDYRCVELKSFSMFTWRHEKEKLKDKRRKKKGKGKREKEKGNNALSHSKMIRMIAEKAVDLVITVSFEFRLNERAGLHPPSSSHISLCPTYTATPHANPLDLLPIGSSSSPSKSTASACIPPPHFSEIMPSTHLLFSSLVAKALIREASASFSSRLLLRRRCCA